VTVDTPAETGAPPASPATVPTKDTLWLVILRELRSRGRNKSFVISTLFSVALVVGLIVVPPLLTGGDTTHQLGVAGPGSSEIAAAAAALAGEGTTVEITAFPAADAAGDAVRSGEIDGAVIDGERLVVQRTGGFGISPLVGLIQQAAGAEEIRALLEVEDAAALEAALRGEVLEVETLSGRDAAHTEGRTWLAYGGTILMWTLILGYGTWALNGVTEEKANRVIEILLAAVPAWQLFAGKIIGIALLGLFQFVVLAAAALVAITLTGAFDLPTLPLDFAAVLGLWVLLGFAMYLVLFGCAGALASKIEDAQSAMSPIITIALVGFFASFAVLGDPDGVIAVVGTFVPFMAPFVVPIRAALETIPLWQHLSAVALSAVTAFALTMLAGRVYRGGALQFAGKVAWRRALRHQD
jgi:ABC-2 type transport system permease protein